ncbi:MAG: hypothetical protein P8018_14155 [Acidobacteriota bacterium]
MKAAAAGRESDGKVFEARLELFRELLEVYVKTGRQRYAWDLRSIVHELGEAGILQRFDCNQNCRLCTWGDPTAPSQNQPCRFLALRESLLDLEPGISTSPWLKAEASAMLAALQVSARPKRI